MKFLLPDTDFALSEDGRHLYNEKPLTLNEKITTRMIYIDFGTCTSNLPIRVFIITCLGSCK
jgi:hypothetical protein